jgi:MFS family permease
VNTDPNARLRRLALATGLASAGLAAGGTGGALLATDLAQSDAVAGLPFALVVAGSTIAAVAISWLTARIGRAPALATGYLAGVVGAAVVVTGAGVDALGLVLAGSLLLGAPNAAVFLARYAGADLGPNELRGRSAGTVLFATALGAVLAPNLLGPSDLAVRAIGLPAFTGLYLVAIGVFLAAALMLARGCSGPDPVPALVSRSDRPPAPRVRALLVLGTASAAMVGIMAVVPLHLAHAGHHLDAIGLVIAIHVAGMFAPSPITGRLVDSLGPHRVAAAAGVLFVASGTWGAVADPASPLAATGFLLVLGLAWNLAVVSGSLALTAGRSGPRRRRAEAEGEVVMGAAAAVGALTAGGVAAVAGWPALSAAGGLIGGSMLITAIVGPRDSRRAAAAQPT